MICNSLIDLSLSFKMLNLFIQNKLNKCNNVLIIFVFSSNFFLSFKRNTVFLFRVCDRQRDVDRDEDRGEDEDEDANPLGKWPHALSPALACLSCTLGLFNISRFSILSVQFGGEYRNCY